MAVSEPHDFIAGWASLNIMGPSNIQDLLAYGLALTKPGQETPKLHYAKPDDPLVGIDDILIESLLQTLVQGAEIAWVRLNGEEMPMRLTVQTSESRIWLRATERIILNFADKTN